jgi:hypothetical protein
MPGNIPPTTWGPFFWHTIHLVALGYPKEPTYAEKRAAKEFYESLVHLIPCPICKLHYAQHLKDLPISASLDSREDLFRWTVTIHNKVNKDLGKPEYTEGESIQFYSRLGALGRSPVYTPEDLESIALLKTLKYAGIGLLLMASLGSAAYYFTSKE